MSLSSVFYDVRKVKTLDVHAPESFILLRLNPLGQRKLPIVISLSRMICFGRVCASACALNVSAALQGAYITPFPTEVVHETKPTYRRLYATCMSSLRTHIFHHDVARISTIFILLRLNPLGQRKLPIVISLSRMLCFGRVCASACALDVSTAVQGAYKSSPGLTWVRKDLYWSENSPCLKNVEKHCSTSTARSQGRP